MPDSISDVWNRSARPIRVISSPCEITFIKILKPRAIGGKSYYKNNVLMVVGAYGGTSGSGKLYSLELDPNSGKVKSQLGVYEGFDRIYEVDIKGF